MGASESVCLQYKEEEAQAKRGKEGDLFDLLREKGVTSSDENEWESVLEKIKEHDAFRKLYKEGMKEWEKIHPYRVDL